MAVSIDTSADDVAVGHRQQPSLDVALRWLLDADGRLVLNVNAPERAAPTDLRGFQHTGLAAVRRRADGRHGGRRGLHQAGLRRHRRRARAGHGRCRPGRRHCLVHRRARSVRSSSAGSPTLAWADRVRPLGAAIWARSSPSRLLARSLIWAVGDRPRSDGVAGPELFARCTPLPYPRDHERDRRLDAGAGRPLGVDDARRARPTTCALAHADSHASRRGPFRRTARQDARARAALRRRHPRGRGRDSRPAGGARRVADVLRARPRPHPPRAGVPPAGRQDAGLRVPRRPPAHAAHARPRGRPGRHGGGPHARASTSPSPRRSPSATTAATARADTPARTPCRRTCRAATTMPSGAPTSRWRR